MLKTGQRVEVMASVPETTTAQWAAYKTSLLHEYLSFSLYKTF